MENAGCYVAVGGPLLAGMFAAVQLMSAQSRAEALLPGNYPDPGGSLVKNILCVNVFLGLVVAVIINGKIATENDTSNSLFAAGLISGLTLAGVSLSIGAIGSVGLVCVRRQPRLKVGMILVVIFAQAIGLYAVIISLVTISKASATRNVENNADITYGEAMQYAACAVAGMLGPLAGITQNGSAVMKMGVFRPDLVMRGLITVNTAGMIGIYTLIAILSPSGGYNNVGASLFICGVIMGFLGSKDMALKIWPRNVPNMLLKQMIFEGLGLFTLIYSLVTGNRITANFDPSEGEQPLTQTNGASWFSGHSAEVFGDEDGSTAKLLLIASSIVLVAITVTTATSVNSGHVKDLLLEADA